MQILGIQKRALENIFTRCWIVVCSPDVKKAKKKKNLPCSKCVCADGSIKKLLKPEECFKSWWKKHHFHLIVYVYGGVFISFTDVIPAISAELPPDCTELVLYLESPAPLPVPLSSKNILNSHREIKGTPIHKGGKGTISQGWDCHFWYDLSLQPSAQQLLAAATISAGKGDWSTCLFPGASRIWSLERLREGSACSIHHQKCSSPASFAHIHKLN